MSGAAVCQKKRGGNFHPSQIAGCLIALRYDFGVENAAGVAATDGQTINRWLDQSGNSRHFVQATEGAKPFFRSAGYLEFNNGTDTNLANADTWALGGDCSIVTKQTYKLPNLNGFFYALNVGGGNGYSPLIFWNRSGNGNAGIYGAPTDDDAYGPNLTPDQSYLFSLRINQNAPTPADRYFKTELDSGTPLVITVNTGTWVPNKIDTIGNYGGSKIYSPQNRVFSLVAFNSILSDTDLAKVKAWCNE